ncbi:hypothetical protein [Streptomyces sp. NPDC001781]
MRFAKCAEEWKAGRRYLADASVRHLNSLLEHHLNPALGSRRTNSFDHKVVDHFIRTMERLKTGMATQANAFDELRAIVLDAHRLGIYTDNPLLGVKPPQYGPARAVVPSTEQRGAIRTAGDGAFLLVVDLMSGCGLRSGEAAAVNLDNLVADDVHRVSEQVIMSTMSCGPLRTGRWGSTAMCPCPLVSGENTHRRAQHRKGAACAGGGRARGHWMPRAARPYRQGRGGDGRHAHRSNWDPGPIPAGRGSQ